MTICDEVHSLLYPDEQDKKTSKEELELTTEVYKQLKKVTKSKAPEIEMDCGSNVVPAARLKKIQLGTLKHLMEYLAPTYGPMGSVTQIIIGDKQDTTYAKYSKDGLTVLKKILFNRPIETAIRSEVEEICRYVESRVGDGTTSAVLLSYFIFDSLIKLEEKHKLPPQVLRKRFESIVNDIKNNIHFNRRPFTLKDVYNICMISTNGNEMVSKDITDIYQKYGENVDISVEISTTPETMLKEYDGITFDEGYSDPAYVNNLNTNTADIHNAKVYLFDDPANDKDMIAFFERILYDNIIAKVSSNQQPIPTVIMCPRLGRDSTAMLNKLIEALYNYDAQNITQQKPQVLVITNYLGVGEGTAYDIGKLCGCKSIKKYIDPEIEKAERESGNAPTLETIHEFAGEAELVSADANKTKFINPAAMMKTPHIYDGLIKFLENEITTATERKEDPLYIGRTKERLKRLKTNNVEYYVGGIAISDRDELRDLVIDAVKNCRSAALNGIGFAANYEGLRASYEMCMYYKNLIQENNGDDECDEEEPSSTDFSNLKLDFEISRSLFAAYYEVSKILYASAVPDAADSLVITSLEKGKPFNVRALTVSLDSDEPVLCSIETDVEILEAAKKIIGLMAASNQCILQSTAINTYN